MNIYPSLQVKNDRISSIRRKHPWIFSRGVLPHEPISDGDIVEIESKKGEYLATGYYQDGSILVRILSFEQREINQKFWDERIAGAISIRQKIGLPNKGTNAYRLFHGEGDGVPGLVIDIYYDCAVIQCHTIGVHRMIDMIKNALLSELGSTIKVVYNKSQNTLPRDYALDNADGFLIGSNSEIGIVENNQKFLIELIGSQKTGFFLDQRVNRQLLSQYTKDKNVLNLYCYTGGFSIYALNHGANKVCSIDASKKAIEILEKNVSLTKKEDRHEAIIEDVNKYLKEIENEEYDIIVVDPPAFAKSVRKRHNAVQAYKRINSLAIKKVKSGGLIFTFSCSQVIDAKLFYDTITAAAIETGRSCRVLHHLSQGPDHPVSIFHPEGKYLKGLVLAIE